MLKYLNYSNHLSRLQLQFVNWHVPVGNRIANTFTHDCHFRFPVMDTLHNCLGIEPKLFPKPHINHQSLVLIHTADVATLLFFAVILLSHLHTTGAGLQCPICSKRFPSCSGQISRECKRSSRVTAKPQLKSATQSYDRSFTLLLLMVANRPRDVRSLTYIHIQLRRAVHQNTSSSTIGAPVDVNF